jgi:alkanesulfonate monooxygenase SsuD/methylene tetrahydromethanopterin reductase-like flavin-dependent oxidoreductase (luciferase family)
VKYGFIVPFATVEENLELATEIEAAGWDGYFTWDGIAAGAGIEMFDPWTLLAGVAVRTERITLGAMIFPLARRRPWVVARQALTIDHLSGGRLVIPVGLGAVDEGGFAKVHPEVTDRKQRAERLDETLEILERAWSGETFSYAGTHYQLDEIQFLPRPVQRPRIPIWTVAAWPRPKSMARATRWDGVIPSIAAPPESRPNPDQVAEICAWMREHRTSEAPFEVVLEGVSPGNDPAWEASILQPLADAGATWWIESRWEAPNDVATLRERIHQGPPRVHSQ